MFENLIGQEEASAFLSGALATSSLPPSLLFHGPWCSGKTTAALELARALSCEENASWSCPCPACERHRRLTHPDLLLFGPDRFLEEIGAALSMISPDSPKRELYAFVRAVRRLTKRFDPALWAGEESKLAKAVPLLSSLEELLTDLDPGSPSADPLEAARKAASEAAKLASFAPQGVPIFQVRAASAWSRFSPSGRRKTLVIEGADLMNEASRNALLKLLEEPPESLDIVLCTERRQAIMETILSRLRPVAFRQRGRGESEEILSRIFSRPGAEAEADSSGLNAVASFLGSFSAFDEAKARSSARSYLATLGASLPRRHPLLPYLPAPAGTDPGDPTDREAFPRFCSALLRELSASLRSGATDPDALAEIGRWSAAVEEAAQRCSVQNQNPEALLPWLSRELSKP